MREELSVEECSLPNHRRYVEDCDELGSNPGSLRVSPQITYNLQEWEAAEE